MSSSAQITVCDLTFGRCVIQASTRQLLVDGQPARLGARAFDVLMALVQRPDAVVSKNELLDTVWPGLVVEENNLQVQVSALRKLLGPETVITIPGRGYRFFARTQDAGERRQPARDNAAPTILTLIGNLPAQLPRLFGRDAELAALATMLQTQTHLPQRLITITGAGGMGKTRLAQAAAVTANHDQANYPDGVWWIELAPVSDRQLVLDSIARALGIALDVEEGAAELAKRIADRQMLIVLDNCEHLINQVAPVAATLLRAVPRLTLLATSQESLKLAGEQVLRLGTLSLPVDELPSAQADTENADQGYGALAMFAARAREAAPQFVLNDDNRAAVVEVCRRLDGIPLAIEFAAARMPLLGIEGLRLRLDDRFRLLTGGSRLAPKRQQTLRAALEWSHSLLSADEQKVFRRFGIFAGSFGIDAAQQVAAGDDFDSWVALDCLGALVDKSLVISEAGVTPRYHLLESARAFALERLRATEEFAGAARRQADAVLKQFNASYAALWTTDSMELLAAVLPDIDNLRMALNWAAVESDDSIQLAALVGASGWLWRPADLAAEGRRWFEVAVNRVTAVMPHAIEARLLLGYATLAHQAAAQKEILALQRAASLYRVTDDQCGLYETLVTLAQKQVWVHDFDGTVQSINEADAIFDPAWPQRAGALRTYADHFAWLAWNLGRHVAAARLLGRADANFVESGFEREESELRAARMTTEGLRLALAPDELERLLSEGAAMTDEAAIRVALGVDRRVGERT